MKKYQMVVIGAGSGGLVAATSAKRAGFSTLLVEKNKIGGECTHFGCIPSKTLLNSAKKYRSLNNLKEFGLGGVTVTGSPEFSDVMEHVDKIVQGVYKHETPQVFEKQGIDVLIHPEGAKFKGKHILQVGPDSIEFEVAIICTGSSPLFSQIPGSDSIPFLHNENFWSLRRLPASVAFIGGGVIAAELGQALYFFGVEVTIFDRNPEILKVLDPDVRHHLQNEFERVGINIIAPSKVTGFSENEGLKKVQYIRDGVKNNLNVEEIFLASGRSPNTGGLNLSAAGIEYSHRGINTNEYLQTSASHIYACGDVTSPLKFTHAASHQAETIINNLSAQKPRPLDMSTFPWAIFTEPEIGHVGLTEAEARRKYGDNVEVFKVPATIDRFVTDGQTRGFLKVIFGKNDVVLGADAIGALAGEWIQLLTLIIKNKIPANQVADTIFSYPTYSEIVKKAFTRYLRQKS